MPTKQDILEAIQGTAKKNGGKPLGAARFEKETGINAWDWGKFWARFSDAQKEAGFTPNQLQGAYADSLIIEKVIRLMRKLETFPTEREMVVERNKDFEFPSSAVFRRLGTKAQLASKIFNYGRGKDGYEDVVKICQSVLKGSAEEEPSEDFEECQILGEVYLFKSGRYYKIGKTNDAVRRGNELRIQLPEKCELLHSIKTEDPSGIESYWHKRFEAKRMNGEWFDLGPAEK